MPPIQPTWRAERVWWRAGHARVAGVDEVGRGPLAGPVVAGAVVLPYTRARWVEQLRDSKQLTAARRAALSRVLRERCDCGIGVVWQQTIDQIGIGPATRLAMRLAVLDLEQPPDALIVDGREAVECDTAQRALVDADALCKSVAAASIVAKVARDRLLEELDVRFPGYGLAQHKGYSSPVHLAALRRLGYSTAHRLSFAPVLAAIRR